MKVPTPSIRKALDMLGGDTALAGFACPDLTTFCRLDELGLVVIGQHLRPDR